MARRGVRRLCACRILLCAALLLDSLCASPDICTNALIPGAKGDQGEMGEEGDEGKLGKVGPPGPPGTPGEMGTKGEVGPTGKMGPHGHRGDKGETGLDGQSGLKGEPGGACDCGRYRKVVGQLDVSVGKLRNAVNFLKKVVLGLIETEESFYLLVKEAKSFPEASMSCRLRGGTLAMPKSSGSNRLLARYLAQAGLRAAYIGVHAAERAENGTSTFRYADSSPLQGFAVWSGGQQATPTPGPSPGCVELQSCGGWARTDCRTSIFFICQFPRSRGRGGGGGAGRGMPAPAS